MTRKVFQLSIELDLHAITCPGVWLCPNNGKVSLCIYMFDTWRETSLIYPVFPLLIHEKFKFSKDISNAKSLSDIQNALNSEHLYCELVQWSETHRSKGIILANFKTCLSNLLYPTDGNKQLITGVDTELLMNPCPPFPGIIAPKIEIGTQTTIKETMSKCSKKCPTYILNPKVIRSAHCGRPEKFRRQRGVCHSDRSRQNENRLRPSSLSKLDTFRTKQHQLDSYDTDYDNKNNQRYVNSIDDNNNDFSTSPCECCKSRLASPVRQCKTISAPKCVCDALVHNQCTVCDKYQHYFNEVTSNMGLGKDGKSTQPDYCRISSPSFCQYQYHARQLHDRVTSALNRCKAEETKPIASKSTNDLYRKYDPNEYTVKIESRSIHPSRYCDQDSIINEYDQTYPRYHKSRPLTSNVIEDKKMYSSYIPRTKSEDSKRECSQRKPQKCKEKILKRPNKHKIDTKLDSYRQAPFSSVYTSNKPKVRLQDNLEMYKPKPKKQLGIRNYNDKNKTNFRSTKVAAKTSIDKIKKSTKTKKTFAKNYPKSLKISFQSGAKMPTSKSHKNSKYIVKTVKKCKKNVNKNISEELNNCVDHLIIIERQSVVKLIEEKIKAGEIKFSNKSMGKSFNTNSSSSTITSKKETRNKCNTKFKRNFAIKKQATQKKTHAYQMKHPFQRIIINTAMTKPVQSVEKSKSKTEPNDSTCNDPESVESKAENTQFKSETEIIEPSMGGKVNVSSRGKNLQDEIRSENLKQELIETFKSVNTFECNDTTCPSQVSVDSIMIDDLMDLFTKQKSESSWKTEYTESDEPKSEIEMIKAKMENLIKNRQNHIKNDLKTKKLHKNTSSKIACSDKTYKNKPFVESLMEDLMNFFKDQKGELDMKSENVNSENPKSNELKMIKASMEKVVNDSTTIENLIDLIQQKRISEESTNIKQQSGITKSEFEIIEASLSKAINEVFVPVKQKQFMSPNTDENNESSITSITNKINRHDQKSELDEYIQNSSIASLVDKISKMAKELGKGDNKSDDNLDEYINNSSIASLVDNIAQMVKKLEKNNFNNFDVYTKNSSIASMVENITTQLTQKFEKSREHFSEDVDEFIKDSSIASMVDNITRTVKKLKKIAKEERTNQQEDIKQNHLQKTDDVVKNTKICQCPQTLNCSNDICKQKWSDDTTSSEYISKDTEKGSINEIWKIIPSNFISSDETCVPKWSSHETNNEFTIRSTERDYNNNSKNYFQSSCSLVHNNLEQTNSYDSNKKQERYFCKHKIPTRTVKSNDSSKLILSDETVNQQNCSDDFYTIDQTNSLTIGTNEIWIKSEPNDKNQQETSTLSDRFANKPPFRKKFLHDKSSTIFPKSSTDMFNEEKTTTSGTGHTYNDIFTKHTDDTNKKWSDDTYDGVITESLTTGIADTHIGEWSNEPGKLIITKSLTSGTDEPTDDTYNHNKIRSLAIGTDDSTHFMSNLAFKDRQTFYSNKMRKPLKVNVNKAFENLDSKITKNQHYPKSVNVKNIDKDFKNRDSSYEFNNVSANIPIRIIDDTKPNYIPNEVPIKKLIGALIKTIEYVNRTRGVKHFTNQKRICFKGSDKIDKINVGQDTSKLKNYKREIASNNSSEHNCYLNIEQLSNALLKTIQYMSKSNRVYDSTDIELESDNFSNIVQSDGTPNIVQKVNESNEDGNYIYKNESPSFISTKNFSYERTEHNIPSLLTNPEFQIKTNHANHLLPVVPNQSDLRENNQTNFDLRNHDDVYPTKLQQSSHSQFLCSKALNSVHDINQQLLHSEQKMYTLIDSEMHSKYTQKQHLTKEKFINKARQSPESIVKPHKVEISNQSKKKCTHFKSISDHILPDYSSIQEEHSDHFHKKPMDDFGHKCHCNIEMMHFNDGYRKNFYTHLETFYEKLYRRAYVRAQQEKQLIERNCLCN